MTEPVDGLRLFAVTGRPVLHSQSPQLFQAAFDALGLDARYLRLAADDAEEVLRLAGQLGLSGFNATAPFKQALAELVAAGDRDSAQLLAINTLVCAGGGWRGYNSDPAGVCGALAEAGLDLSGLRAVVVGAGGAGRAAAWGLARAGARVVLVNRSPDKAQRAAVTLGCCHARLDELPARLAEAQALVVCLPPDASVIEPGWLHPGLSVLEADYAHGPVRELAQRAGCRVVAGRAWLLHQALAAFEWLLGRQAPGEAMRRALAAEPAGPAANLALVGLSGSGKTSVGRLLAGRLGWGFVDTDQRVEQAAGRSIARIFAEKGEAGFRRLEREALDQALGAERQVIACGGGAVLDQANRARLRARSQVIWLWAPPELCLARVEDGSRPLLTGDDPLGRAADMLAERRPLYAAVCDLVIGVEGRSAGALADRIQDEVRSTRAD